MSDFRRVAEGLLIDRSSIFPLFRINELRTVRNRVAQTLPRIVIFRHAMEERWTVPVNFIVSKLSTFGTFPASYQFGMSGFPVHPGTGPSWKMRRAIIILLPRKG